MTIRQAYLMFTLNGTSGAGAVTTLFFDVVTDESWDGANIITEHPVETGSNVADNIRVGLRECQLTIFATNEPFQGNSFTIPQSLETVIGPFEVDGTAQIVPDTLVAQEWENGLQLSSAVQAGAILGSQAIGNLVPKLPTGAVNLGTTLGANLLTPAFAYPYPFTPNLGLEDNPGIQQSVGLLAQPDDTIDFVARMYEILELLRTSGTLITVYGSKNGCQNMAIESINMDRSADTGTGAEFIIKLKEIRFVSTQTVTAPQPTIKAAVTKVSKGNQNPTPATPPVAKSVAKRLFGDILNQGGGSPNAEQLSSTGLTQADLPNPAIDTGAP